MNTLTVHDMARKLYEKYAATHMFVGIGIEKPIPWEECNDHEKGRWCEVTLIAIAMIKVAVVEGEMQESERDATPDPSPQ